MDFNTLRQKYAGYSDDEILSALKATKYPDYSLQEIAQATGYKPKTRNPAAYAPIRALALRRLVSVSLRSLAVLPSLSTAVAILSTRPATLRRLVDIEARLRAIALTFCSLLIAIRDNAAVN